jgi:DegV family protein with EDD domain
MNPGRVVVITDSTAYLPADLRSGVVIVPVQVVIAGQAYDETEPDTDALVTAALRSWQPVTTSRPSPERFRQVYEEAAAAGASAVVCATLSSDMSATHESAVLAARDVSIEVRTVDSRTVGMALGFAVLEGAERAADGASADEVAAVIEKRCATSTSLFYVDTLEYLRRGGRIGAARAAVGTALQVKPILQLVDGRVAPLEKVRTSGRAISRLEDLAAEAAGDADVDIAVQQLGAAERAATLAARLSQRLPQARVLECPIGAVVGAHVGPGMVAVVVSPR